MKMVIPTRFPANVACWALLMFFAGGIGPGAGVVLSQEASDSGLKPSPSVTNAENERWRTVVKSAIHTNRSSLGGLRCVVVWKSTSKEVSHPTNEVEKPHDPASGVPFKLSATDPHATTPTNEYLRKVVFHGEKLRAETYIGGRLTEILATDGRECEYFCPDQITDYHGTKRESVLSRHLITARSLDGWPVIDPRDFGATAGVGRLEKGLSDWTVVSAKQIHDAESEVNCVQLVIEESKPAMPRFAERWTLVCDVTMNYLPTSVVVSQGELLVSKVIVQYAPIVGSRNVYFPTRATLFSLNDPTRDVSAFDSPQNTLQTVELVVSDVEQDNSLQEKSPFLTPEAGVLVRDNIRSIIGVTGIDGKVDED